MVAALLPQGAEAQPTRPATPVHFWANASVDTSTAGLSGVAAGAVSVKARHLAAGRALRSEELWIELFDRTVPHEHTWEAGLLYGQTLSVGPGVVVVAGVGLGAVGGVRRGAFLRTEREVISEGTKLTPPLVAHTDVHERNEILTIGVPVELSVTFRPLSFLGIGIVGFANVNAAAPFAGAAAQVQVGWWP